MGFAMVFEARKYHAYARECLALAEKATSADHREKLIELSHVWMEAALREEMLVTPNAPTSEIIPERVS
jgi:hypothetical protein